MSRPLVPSSPYPLLPELTRIPLLPSQRRCANCGAIGHMSEHSFLVPYPSRRVSSFVRADPRFSVVPSLQKPTGSVPSGPSSTWLLKPKLPRRLVSLSSGLSSINLCGFLSSSPALRLVVVVLDFETDLPFLLRLFPTSGSRRSKTWKRQERSSCLSRSRRGATISSNLLSDLGSSFESLSFCLFLVSLFRSVAFCVGRKTILMT